MIRIEQSIELEAEPARVYAVVARLEGYPDWLPGVRRVRAVTGDTGSPGSTFRLFIDGPAGPLEALGRVLRAEPPSLLEIEAAAAPVLVNGLVTVSSTQAGRSAVTVGMQVELRGAYRFAESLVAGQLTAGLPGTLERLRAAVAAEPPA